MKSKYFFGSLITLVIVALIFKFGKELFPPPTIVLPKNQFSPSEIADLVKESPSNVAGESMNRKFHLHSYDNLFTPKKYKYCYIDVNLSKWHSDYECTRYMKELIIFNDSFPYFTYTIQNTKANLEFYSILKDSSQEIIPNGQFPLLKNNETFVMNDCVFSYQNYDNAKGGYTYVVMPKKILLGMPQNTPISAPEEQSKPIVKNAVVKEKKEVSKLAIITVNTANLFKRIDDGLFVDGSYGNVSKGTKLTIIKKEGNYYYCDYDDNGAKGTAWVSKDDLAFEAEEELEEITLHK